MDFVDPTTRRFSRFELAELQQILVGLYAGRDLMAAGSGNLIPGLIEECSEALDRAIAEESS